MEPCADHSGHKVKLAEHERRLNTYEGSIKRIHQRQDETNTLIAEVRDEVSKKLMQYGQQTAEQLGEAMRMFSDPKDGVILGKNGLKAQVEAHDRSLKLSWKIIAFVLGPPILYVIMQVTKKLIVFIQG